MLTTNRESKHSSTRCSECGQKTVPKWRRIISGGLGVTVISLLLLADMGSRLPQTKDEPDVKAAEVKNSAPAETKEPAPQPDFVPVGTRGKLKEALPVTDSVDDFNEMVKEGALDDKTGLERMAQEGKITMLEPGTKVLCIGHEGFLPPFAKIRVESGTNASAAVYTDENMFTIALHFKK